MSDPGARPAEPRPSATICVLRDSAGGLEVMMGKRSNTAKFMADAWVFPGGRVDELDQQRAADLVMGDNDPHQLAWVAAALRETVEEAGLWLTDPPRREPLAGRDVYTVLDEWEEVFVADLHLFANWVTPADLPIRYDTRFFACVVDHGLDPIPDGHEIDQAEWVRPQRAIERAAAGEWLIPFPTHVTLESLSRAETAAEFLAATAGMEIDRLQPRIRILSEGGLEVVMPGEPGFDELPEATGNLEALAAAARRTKGTRHTIAEID